MRRELMATRELYEINSISSRAILAAVKRNSPRRLFGWKIVALTFSRADGRAYRKSRDSARCIIHAHVQQCGEVPRRDLCRTACSLVFAFNYARNVPPYRVASVSARDRGSRRLRREIKVASIDDTSQALGDSCRLAIFRGPFRRETAVDEVCSPFCSVSRANLCTTTRGSQAISRAVC